MNKMLTYEELLAKVASLEAANLCMQEQNKNLVDENKRKQERIAYLERMLFGSKRDKAITQQEGPGLFDDFFKELMDNKEAEIAEVAKEIKEEANKRRASSKKKEKRPAKYQYYGLEERLTTVYPEGINIDEYDVIGKDCTRILHREAAKLWVEVIERPLLRRKADKGSTKNVIYQAPKPNAVIGGNHVAADLLSQIILDKFVYHIPEYRQVKQYADLGVTLSTSTINDWVHAVASKLYPLYEALGEDIRSRTYLQIDEVPWRIADKPGKSRNGYAWQFLDATPKSHGLYFYYLKGCRGGKIPRAQLKGYKGAIQTDGYKVYDYFEQDCNVTLLGCMAHVRRKFTEAQNSHAKRAKEALGYISLLYELEANLKSRYASPDEIAKERQEKAIPIMNCMEEWMKNVSKECTPSDLLGKAIDYAYKLWPRLRRYTENGVYQIDNNPVERNQRASVMGRKNYLFSKNNRGAEDNAVFYSLLESCELVGIKPLKWLNHVLLHLHDDCSEEDVVKLLPYNYKESQA